MTHEQWLARKRKLATMVNGSISGMMRRPNSSISWYNKTNDTNTRAQSSMNKESIQKDKLKKESDYLINQTGIQLKSQLFAIRANPQRQSSSSRGQSAVASAEPSQESRRQQSQSKDKVDDYVEQRNVAKKAPPPVQKQSSMMSSVQSAQLDKILRATVEQIWDIYDEDGNGVLDFDETKVFLNDYMEKFGKGEKLKLKEIKVLFKEIDEDKSGTLDKDEIIDF